MRSVQYVDPRAQIVRVFAPRKTPKTVRMGQTLDGGSVLEGFTLALKELFRDPVG